MNKKQDRLQHFEKLTTYFNEFIKNNFEVQSKAEVLSLLNDSTASHDKKVSKITFKQENATTALLDFKNPLLLVFNSAYNPGGGVTRGSVAQEEDISLKTTWYFQVKHNTEYYNQHHDTLLYSDEALYIEKAFLLFDNYFNQIEPKPISLIGAAAPNLAGMKNNPDRAVSEAVVYHTLENRLISLLKIAEEKKHDSLILGAWGCGVFGLDYKKVADIYNKILNANYYSGEVCFSILDSETFGYFKNNLTLSTAQIKKNKTYKNK